MHQLFYPFDDAIGGVVSHMMSGGLTASKAVNPETVDFGTAPHTCVCGTDARVRCVYVAP